MIEVKNLKRSYGDLVAVHSATFNINSGEIIGLLGHNGAGKTTIMKMLSGYLEPDEGLVRVGGINLLENPRAVKQLLGYLPESLPVYPEMSVIDYLDYAAALKGLSSEPKNAAIRRVVEATDLGSKLTAPIATLSRGYRQRVGVAQAILGSPRVLILDEPTNGLDPTQTQQMRELIRSLASQATIILSTHIMQEVDAICDRVLILSDGELVVDATLADLRRSEHVILHSDIPASSAREQLNGIEGVAEVTPLPELEQQPRYRVRLTTPEAAIEVSARLVNSLVGAGYRVFAVQPEHRDLEVVFREAARADRQGGLSYAA